MTQLNEQEQTQLSEQVARAFVEEHENMDVEDIPWGDPSELTPDVSPSRFVEEYNPNIMQVVEGVTLDFSQGASPELKALVEQAHSYIGVIPRKMDAYAGRWITMTGAVVLPISHQVINEETGEVGPMRRWKTPLFKLDAKDDVTGLPVILNGGGRYGLQFAREMNVLYGVGDWEMPLEVFISQEGRTAKDGSPRRMYRFAYRPISAKVVTNTKK
jgi:hypothetical protein